MKHLGPAWARAALADIDKPSPPIVPVLPPPSEKNFTLTGVDPLQDRHSGPPGELDIRLTTHLFQKQMAMIGRADGSSFGDVDAFVRQLAERFAPRDVVEELLLGQILMTHGRLALLTHLCCRSPDASRAMELHAAAKRATNTLRRLAKAIADYRRPMPKVAIQTIIQKVKKHENEKGLADDQTLPLVEKGVTQPEIEHSQDQTVAQDARTEIADGQAAHLT